MLDEPIPIAPELAGVNGLPLAASGGVVVAGNALLELGFGLLVGVGGVELTVTGLVATAVIASAASWAWW